VSVRWGLGAGVVSAVLGLLALFIGAVVEPIQTVSTAYAVVQALFVRGLLALLALAMALALAYYAGWQVEAQLAPQAEDDATPSASLAPSPATASSPSAASASRPRARVSDARIQAALTGAFVLAVYWLVTTLYIVTLGSRIGGVGAQGVAPLTFTLDHLIQGIVFVGLGAGAGGLGGRAAAARLLLQRLTARATAGPSTVTHSPTIVTGRPTAAEPTAAEAAPPPDDAPEAGDSTAPDR